MERYKLIAFIGFSQTSNLIWLKPKNDTIFCRQLKQTAMKENSNKYSLSYKPTPKGGYHYAVFRFGFFLAPLNYFSKYLIFSLQSSIFSIFLQRTVLKPSALFRTTLYYDSFSSKYFFSFVLY